jgi:hypothetical protein
MPATKPTIPTGKKFHTHITRIGACDHVTLYATTIAIRDNEKGTITLRTGGYNTPTTIRRMNECLNQWVGPWKCRVNKATFKKADEVVFDIATANRIHKKG